MSQVSIQNSCRELADQKQSSDLSLVSADYSQIEHPRVELSSGLSLVSVEMIHRVLFGPCEGIRTVRRFTDLVKVSEPYEGIHAYSRLWRAREQCQRQGLRCIHTCMHVNTCICVSYTFHFVGQVMLEEAQSQVQLLSADVQAARAEKAKLESLFAGKCTELSKVQAEVVREKQEREASMAAYEDVMKRAGELNEKLLELQVCGMLFDHLSISPFEHIFVSLVLHALDLAK